MVLIFHIFTDPSTEMVARNAFLEAWEDTWLVFHMPTNFWYDTAFHLAQQVETVLQLLVNGVKWFGTWDKLNGM